jgi:hypothetical protein
MEGTRLIDGLSLVILDEDFGIFKCTFIGGLIYRSPLSMKDSADIGSDG